MKIIKSKKYTKDIEKKIVKLHKDKELKRIELIEELIKCSINMKDLILNPLAIVYNIEKKRGDLKEFYTARINEKLRMYIKPIGEYPYKLEEIIEVELVEIDDKHYGDG